MNKKASKKLIFVVEDDMPSYQLIVEILSGYPAFFKHFTNGHDFLRDFKTGPFPDLIIMDIQLPGVDGLVLTREVKLLAPSVPVIAYTSYAMPGDKDICLRGGCDDYISKPIDIEVFLDMITKYMDL